MTDYILEITFDDPAQEELIQSRLFLTASSGSSSTDTTISAYFDAPHDREEARRALEEIVGIDLRDADRERVDWLEHYQQSLQPILIGNSFVIAPDARLFEANETRHRLVIPQEQAFGTGSHETTALCIEILETLDLAGKRALDVGAGSGILALAMIRLGARKVIAFDNDVDAYAALRDNRMRNDVAAERMPLFIGSLEALRPGVFDVVVMNILPEIIIPLLRDVVTRVRGALILSGILGTVAPDVIRSAERHGLALAAERAKGEWWAGSFTIRRS